MNSSFTQVVFKISNDDGNIEARLDVQVENFSEILSWQFPVNWNPDELKLLTVYNVHPALELGIDYFNQLNSPMLASEK